jgi:REP element-mobilizing transposase RayT
MPQSLAALYCHIVFSTKNREAFIDETLERPLYAYVGGILRENKGVLVAAGGMPDHVHLLVSMSRESAVSDLVRAIKANSSRWIHEGYPNLASFAWQVGYGAFSVSVSQLDVVKKYLAEQKTHHAKQSFQDEFRALLEKHGLSYDERYVWD